MERAKGGPAGPTPVRTLVAVQPYRTVVCLVLSEVSNCHALGVRYVLKP